MKQLPNFVTAVRLILTPFLVLAIVREQWAAALWVGIIAGLTDVLDGWAARLLKLSSRVGAYFDPIADKLMLTAAYAALGIAHLLAWRVVALVFGRDIFILGMAAYGYFFTSIRQFPPSVWGKLSTFVQIFTAMAVVAERAGSGVSATAFVWLMVVTTGWSGVHYGWVGYRLWRAEARSRLKPG